jgi:hypothetical protein
MGVAAHRRPNPPRLSRRVRARRSRRRWGKGAWWAYLSYNVLRDLFTVSSSTKPSFTVSPLGEITESTLDEGALLQTACAVKPGLAPVLERCLLGARHGRLGSSGVVA